MKTKFLQTCLGVSMILLAAGFLIRSFDVAYAAQSPEKYLSQNANKIGKFMVMRMFDKDILVWDTETGKSVYYYYSLDPKTNVITMKTYPLLPEKPLE